MNPGQIVENHYRIDTFLGEGGSGVVYKAEHIHLKQPVALKVMHHNEILSTDHVSRFYREARLLFAMRSENVVRVTDFGVTEHGYPFMVLEYLETHDLKHELTIRPHFEMEEAISIALSACRGVAELHAFGIVHRDLKPSNLFLHHENGGLPAVKIVDLGIAKTVKVNADNIGATTIQTATGIVMGTPQYMSPEQFSDPTTVDETTDIWALGVILYQLLTGREPFQGDNVQSLYFNIARAEPIPPQQIRPSISDTLAEIIRRCLEKDRTHRFPNALSLAAALQPLHRSNVTQVTKRTLPAFLADGMGTTIDQGMQFEPTTTGSYKESTHVTAIAVAPQAQTAAPTRPMIHFAIYGVFGFAAALGIVLLQDRLHRTSSYWLERFPRPAVIIPQVEPQPSPIIQPRSEASVEPSEFKSHKTPTPPTTPKPSATASGEAWDAISNRK